MSVENGMVVRLDAALERHYAALDPTAVEFAELRVLGDIGLFCDQVLDAYVGYNLSDAADRALRIDSRLADADSDVVLAALLLAAYRNDAADTLRAAKLLVGRYLAGQADRIARIAGGDE